MAVINTNVKALFSQMALKNTGLAQSTAMQQLSTGKRINSARDDAAGMAIATRMTHQIRSLNQAVRNAGDAISLIQTAEGATNEITDMMQRMRELAIQAVNDTNDSAQRSYLDLEFQQLKQQIVQIADNTEWNGFPVLNGKAGEQVGEMPVYKATSNDAFGNVLLSPTTTRVIEGAGSGEQQVVSINTTGIPSDGFADKRTFKFAGENISLEWNDINDGSGAVDPAKLAAQIQTQLQATEQFGAGSGRTVAVDGATNQLVITYSANDGDVHDIQLTDKSNDGYFVLDPVVVSRDAITQTQEKFDNNGRFLRSGNLVIEHVDTNNDGTRDIKATFVTPDNKSVNLVGSFDSTKGTVTFDAKQGINSSVISDNLTYFLKDSVSSVFDGSNANANGDFTNDLLDRHFKLSIDVSGSIPAMRAGDLLINGVEIGGSFAVDDPFSPINNAAGSAIAKAAAINRKAAVGSGPVGESQSVTFSGNPIPGVITVGGVSVELTAMDNTPALATAKIAQAMRTSAQFGEGSGRTVSYAPGSTVINVDFPVTDGEVSAIDVQQRDTNLASVTDTTRRFSSSSSGTGVFAKVNENIFTGKSMSGNSVVSGVVFVNGVASAKIETLMNNPRDTRANVVRAINLISDKTGVKAVDTGSDLLGVTLTAADGRNIEVTFETTATAKEFGNRIGMREGVQSATISLESKIPNAVVLTSSAVGDISRVGFLEGNYSKNQAVFNTKERPLVDPAVKQVSSLTFTGPATADDKFTLVVNGEEHTITATGGESAQELRDLMVAELDNDQNVEVLKGNTVGELIIRAKTAGRSFTAATAMVPAADPPTADISAVQVEVENKISPFKSLGTDDLEINGVKIRATNSADDIDSNQVASSSNPAASAIAMAHAINTHSSETGVRAIANPVVLKGGHTSTGSTKLETRDAPPNNVKAVNQPEGFQSLYLNGTEIKVEFKADDTPSDRRINLVRAINTYSGTHGIVATDNGKGLTLEAPDGRNVSVWYDASIEGLSPASFGLEEGNSESQISKVKMGGSTIAVGDTLSVNINGTTITTDPTTDMQTPAGMATAMMTAINSAIAASVALDADSTTPPSDRTHLSNLIAYIDPNDATSVLVQSKVPGSPFVMLGAAALNTGSDQTLSIGTLRDNSFGSNQITGIVAASENSTDARTVYGTVRLIATPAQLPALPGTDGKAPNLTGISGKPITIKTGDDGFGSASNFADLGFSVGSFGGRSSSDMDPPRVGRLAFQVGSSARQMVTIDLADFGKGGPITGEITGDVDQAVENRAVRINTRDGATAVLNLLDEAMDKVNATRATMGAVMNRLDHVINNLTNVSMNMSASRSQIEDADYASASTELAKTQIMQQAATAVLAQANTSQQSVLKLLGG